MATDLALSLREHDEKPVALVLGEELRPVASDRHLSAFDLVVPLPAGYAQFLSKLAVPWATPFERSVFIDADSLAIGSLRDLWGGVEASDFAVQGRYVGAGEDHEHHFFSTAALVRNFGLDAICGTMRASSIFAARRQGCLGRLHATMGGRFRRQMPFDEPLRGVVAERFGIATIQPYPMAWWPIS